MGSSSSAASALTRRAPCALLVDGTDVPFREGVQRAGDVEVAVMLSPVRDALRLDWCVRNPGRRTVSLSRVGVRLDVRAPRVIEQGWQSWSVVRRCSPQDIRPVRRSAPRWRQAMYLADATTAGRCIAGDQVLVDHEGVTGFLSGASHLGSVHVHGDGLDAWALLDGAALAPGAERQLEPLWIGAGDPGELYSAFAAEWGARGSARTAANVPLGWCSWYQHWGGVTPGHVRAAIGPAAAHGFDVVQIDDGYQASIGEWRSHAAGWSCGTAALATDISASGMRPGIWTAPFLVAAGGAVARTHPEWVVRDERGSPVGAMYHPRLWGGWAWALDTTHPGVLEHLARTFAGLVADGFAYFKCDFLYGAALPGRRHDVRATRAEALRRGLAVIRAAIGDRFLLACGCPFGPAVGVVDAMRVSTDVSPSWDNADPPHRSRRGFAETLSGVRNAVRASVLRAPLHRRLWLNDPDCVIQRESPLLSAAQRSIFADVVAATGGFTVVSDELARYSEAEWGTVAALRRAASAGGAVDLLDPFSPAPTVRSAAGDVTVDWHGDGASKWVARG